jgi:hypothetical protein
MDAEKSKFYEKFKDADFTVDYDKYKSSLTYRFNVDAKFYTRKVPLLVWLFCAVGGMVIMVNVNQDLGRFLLVVGFFALIFYNGNLTGTHTQQEWEQMVRGAAWFNNKCYHCWKTVSKAATKCPHCTGDLSSKF